jgi:predicted negative regulator of RcsB-dependent stress response
MIAFVTETIGDLYREQGHYHQAREVYRQLLESSENPRLADKLIRLEEDLDRKGR